MQTPTIEPMPARQMPLEAPPAETTEAAWKPLYRIGGVAALIGAAIIPIAIIVFIVWSPPGFQPTASNVIDWFKFFQKNPLVGLLDLDLLFLAGQALIIPVYLALYAALRRASPSLMTLALALGLIGTAVYFTANQAFSMLFLSNQYAAAATDAERSSLVSVGQTMLANYQGTSFDVSYVLGAVTMLLIAGVMLRSALFSKGIAYVGLLMGVLMLVPANAGTLGIVLSLVSLVPTVIWDVLIALRLFQLGRGVSQAGTTQML